MTNFIIKMKRAEAASWAFLNPVLKEGEPGFERDTGRLKIGDGYTPWLGLSYLAGAGGDTPASLEEHIIDTTPHPVYDDGPSLVLLWENAKV